MKKYQLIVAFATATVAFGASAQNLKPGLWELTHKMGGSGEMGAAMAEMQREMANMPPEQKKMMQEMMAKHGMQMNAGGAGGMSTRVCMTKEMVERSELPVQQGDCRTTSQQRSGNTMKFAVKCSNPPSSGEGQVTFVSSEAYNMKMNMKMAVDGKPQNVTMDGSGKWLGADCGNIKPLPAPKK